MRKILIWTVLAAALLAAAAVTGAAAEEEEAEWTVMFYFCGADLESRYGYASENLAEIGAVTYPSDIRSFFTAGDSTVEDTMRDIGRVQILIETGGAKAWNSEPAGIYVSPSALQRWSYSYFPEDTGNGYQFRNEFRLLETLPLRSMSDPETLAEYIRWGVENYPAKKYALVLWGHGAGSGAGLLIDELFDNDIMSLAKLRDALAGGGAYMEAIVIDACLMANIETAWVAKDYAHWLVASEETVPGQGSAIGDWLQDLVNHPALDGRWLGRCVCDAAENKYAAGDDRMSRSLLTWSVIDLTKMERLGRAVDGVFQMINDNIRQNHIMCITYAKYLFRTEQYGDERYRMRDFGGLLYDSQAIGIGDSETLDEAMAALADAVDYNVRGDGHSTAYGLTFFYGVGASESMLDQYAEVCPSPAMLACLDSVSSWTAPDSVYEQTIRLGEINTSAVLRMTVERAMAPDGLPALQIGNVDGLSDIYYRLYQLDEESDQVLLLGKTNCRAVHSGEYGMLWEANDPMHWPSIDGVPCCIEIVRHSGMSRLYHIPVQINTNTAVLLCNQTTNSNGTGSGKNGYEIYGVWEGYQADATAAIRGAQPLAMLSGRYYRLLYPVDTAGSRRSTAYFPGEEQTMYRQLDLEEMPLPPGTYYIEYELQDLFMRAMRTERFEIHWDGQQITLPDGFAWEGPVTMNWTY